MTTVDPATSHPDTASDLKGDRRYLSERGPYQVFTAPAVVRPPKPEEVTDEMVDQFLTFFDGFKELVSDQQSEEEVVSAMKEMARAAMPGMAAAPIVDQGGPNGMSVWWAWFGPNFELWRHGHPGIGDCLYLVFGGTMHLGNRVIGPGGGFFVPEGMPYKYRAGREGVQVLEIRAGMSVPLGSPRTMKLGEPSIEALNRLTGNLLEHQAEWTSPPAQVGDQLPGDRQSIG